MDNSRVAEVFEELADRLELVGENPFKTRAYRSFAEEVRGLDRPLAAIVAEGRLATVPGVGKAIAQKVPDLLATGTFPALERARAATPAGLLDLLRVPGLGVKTVRLLWERACITSPAELAYACDEGFLGYLSGFGAKKQEKTLAALRRDPADEAMLLAVAHVAAELLVATLSEAGATRIAVVGETRRGLEVVNELEMLVEGLTVSDVRRLIEEADDELLVRDMTTSDTEVHVTMQGRGAVRLRIVPPEDWTLELIERTGDAAHVQWLEDRAESAGGVAAVARRSESEEEVYAALGLSFVPPDLRVGPVPNVPELIERHALRGVFHVHTSWSDGTASIVEMARAASHVGLDWVGISDHSRAASYANGLDGARLIEQMKEIEEARAEAPEVGIFHGVEVDILPDGSLDIEDEILEKLDFVIASVHSRFNMPADEMTARLVRAVSHPLVTMLGHPTGRLLLGKKGYAFDLERVASAAAANDTYLEINCNAHRLDLAPPLARKAAACGAYFAVNPDAHAPRGLHDMPLGVFVARRAGLDRNRVLNTLDRRAIAKRLDDRRAARR